MKLEEIQGIQSIVFNATTSLFCDSKLKEAKTLYEDYKKAFEAFEVVSEYFGYTNNDINNKLIDVMHYHLVRLENNLSFNLIEIQNMLIDIKKLRLSRTN